MMTEEFLDGTRSFLAFNQDKQELEFVEDGESSQKSANCDRSVWIVSTPNPGSLRRDYFVENQNRSRRVSATVRVAVIRQFQVYERFDVHELNPGEKKHLGWDGGIGPERVQFSIVGCLFLT